MTNTTISDPNDTGSFPYKPNITAAGIAAVLFGLSGLLHLVIMSRKKTWYYTSMTVGAAMMTGGWAFRVISAKSPSDTLPFVMQSILIILPPSLYAATIYMIYGRIVIFVKSPEASVIRPTRVTKIFVFGDVVAFLLQAGGGGLMAQESKADLGQKVLLVGLFVQLIFFGFFLCIAILFWKRMRSSTAIFKVQQHGSRTWQSLLYLLFVAASIIIARCIFRVIEFAQGHDGYLASHEAFIYVFDAAPMLGVQMMFHFVHGGDVFPPGGISMGKMDSESYIGLQER